MAERIKPPWWLKPVNRVMITLDKVGVPVFSEGRAALLTVTGRKSGKARQTPITPMVVDGRRYVVGGLPGADWVRNARANPLATLRQGRRAQRVRMVEMPVDQARPLLRRFPELVPTGVDFIRNAGLVTEGTPEEFEALAGTCAVFRFDPLD
jgi:deazaflavin-dependent oxidoreductase (nitroreductase family)